MYVQYLQNEIRSLVTLGDGAAGGGASMSYEVGRGKKKRKESTSGPQLFDNDVEWWGGEEVRSNTLEILPTYQGKTRTSNSCGVGYGTYLCRLDSSSSTLVGYTRNF